MDHSEPGRALVHLFRKRVRNKLEYERTRVTQFRDCVLLSVSLNLACFAGGRRPAGAAVESGVSRPAPLASMVLPGPSLASGSNPLAPPLPSPLSAGGAARRPGGPVAVCAPGTCQKGFYVETLASFVAGIPGARRHVRQHSHAPIRKTLNRKGTGGLKCVDGETSAFQVNGTHLKTINLAVLRPCAMGPI